MTKKRVPSNPARKRRSAIATYNAPPRDPNDQATYNEFARRLQAAMIDKGWGQSELARQATARAPKGKTIHRADISRFIRGKNIPLAENLGPIARCLGVAVADLLPPGVPTATRDISPLEWKTEGDGRVHMRMNCIVSMDVALKISELVRGDTGAPALHR